MRMFTKTGLILLVATLVCRLAWAQNVLPDYGKLSSGFRQLVIKEGLDSRVGKAEREANPNREFLMLQERTPYRIGNETYYEALLYVADPAALQSAGFRTMATVPAKDGYFVTAHLTARQIAQASTLQFVRHVGPGTVVYPTNDAEGAEAGMPLLHDGMVNGTKYTGRNAVALIYDSGIDWRHLDFRDPVDTTKSRILFMWDQTITPQGGETSPVVAGIATPYGVEYTKAQIEAQLASANPPVPIRLRDTNGHGTHVAGTMAGNGAAYLGKYTGWPTALFGKYKGAAPEADIIAVKGGNGSFSSTNIINCFAYAQAKAQQLNKPVVINMSLGGHFGAHDGSEPMEVAADNYCNSGPGRSAVIAAGNEGGTAIHVGGNIAAGGSTSFTFNLGPNTLPARAGRQNQMYVLVYLSDSSTATATITPPTGASVSLSINSVSSGANARTLYLERGVVTYTRPGAKRYFVFGIMDTSDAVRPATGSWTFAIQNVARAVSWDGWLIRNDFTANGFSSALPTADGNETVGIPGTSVQALTVGAYAIRGLWAISDGSTIGFSTPPIVGGLAGFSSIGPTSDGRIKPEITASGQGVISTLSSSSQSSVSTQLIVLGGRHRINSGTSMATPFVAGVATLLYGINPGLTHAQLRSLITSTARTDALTGPITAPGNAQWGLGKINPVGAVARMLNTNNTTTLTPLNFTFQAQLNSPPNFGSAGQNTPIAQRFTVTSTAWAAQAMIQPPNGSSTVAGATGNGNVTIRIFSNGANNLPGTQIGNTVSVPAQSILASAINPISLASMRANLTPGEYHLVIGTDDAATTVRVAYANSAGSDRASVTVAGTWQRAGAPSTGVPTDINFALGLYLASGSGTVITNVENTPSEPAPTQDVVLEPNQPNPVSSATTFGFSMAKSGNVKLEVYSHLGQLVSTVFEGRLPAGRHQVQWDALGLPNGLYYYRLQTDYGNPSRRMVIAR